MLNVRTPNPATTRGENSEAPMAKTTAPATILAFPVSHQPSYRKEIDVPACCGRIGVELIVPPGVEIPDGLIVRITSADVSAPASSQAR